VSRPLRVVVSAAEASGDALAAALVRALAVRADIDVCGVGGPAMRAAGVRPVDGCVPLRPAMGTVEVLGSLWGTVRNLRAVWRALDRADLLVVVDAPDQHLPLARLARGRVPVVGYVSPQVWAWRAGRVHAVAQALDQLLCLWPFEPALYAGTGLDARFVGHPASERSTRSTREEGVLAVVPGSRPAEVRRHLATFLAVARETGAREVLLPRASTITEEGVGTLPPWVRPCAMEDVLARADRALTKSGTSTLELALAGIPAVVAHRVSPITWAVARRFTRGLRHVALPNILLESRVQEEHLQHLDVAGLGEALARAQPVPVEALRARLEVPGGPSAAAAEAVLSRWG